MNQIQSEYLRQAALAQQFGQAMPQAVFYRTPAMLPDYYAGATKSSGGFLKKALLVLGAVVFRKNIANVTRRYFPQFAEGVGRLFVDAKGFIRRFKGSDYLAQGWHKYTEYETKAGNFFRESLATETGQKITNKTKGWWDTFKGWIMKAPEVKK